MKILFISMPSIHAVRWIENLKESGHELYWFDVLDKGKLPTEIKMQQITNWKKRKVPYIKGEYFLNREFSALYNVLQPFLEVTVNQRLDQILSEIQPDLVHSFEMQSCSYPILKTMQKYSHIKWLYSCWGSDLFRYKEIPHHLAKIKAVLKRVNYIHVDCQRDYVIAKELGFLGKNSGVIPGGGGFHLEQFASFTQPVLERKIILVKGYQHHFGRALVVVRALQRIQTKMEQRGFEVVVFGAHQAVFDYITENTLPYQVYDRHALNHQDLMKMMGKSVLYIGNSISDGMPNTLLEAIIMGAFPIQSNPGNVTSEIINHGENGFLIAEPNDEEKISKLIMEAIGNLRLIQNAFVVNQEIAKSRLNYYINQQKILALYQQIERDTCE